MSRHRSACAATSLSLLLCLSVFAVAATADDAVSLRGAVVAGGGGASRSAQGCYALDGTIGESASGTSGAGEFAVQAGFWAGAGKVRRDSIFHDRFEECQ